MFHFLVVSVLCFNSHLFFIHKEFGKGLTVFFLLDLFHNDCADVLKKMGSVLKSFLFPT